MRELAGRVFETAERAQIGQISKVRKESPIKPMVQFTI